MHVTWVVLLNNGDVVTGEKSLSEIKKTMHVHNQDLGLGLALNNSNIKLNVLVSPLKLAEELNYHENQLYWEK